LPEPERLRATSKIAAISALLLFFPPPLALAGWSDWLIPPIPCSTPTLPLDGRELQEPWAWLLRGGGAMLAPPA